MYPSFACGSGNVLSADLARWVADNQLWLKPYQVRPAVERQTGTKREEGEVPVDALERSFIRVGIGSVAIALFRGTSAHLTVTTSHAQGEDVSMGIWLAAVSPTLVKVSGRIHSAKGGSLVSLIRGFPVL